VADAPRDDQAGHDQDDQDDTQHQSDPRLRGKAIKSTEDPHADQHKPDKDLKGTEERQPPSPSR